MAGGSNRRSEDEAFWSALAPIMFDAQRWAEAPLEIARVVALLQVQPGGSFLDLCCGPGRHSLALARQGFRVTGVDIQAAYLESARKQAQAEALAAEFVQADMRRFCRPDAFDAAINIQTSFGYFEDQAENRQVLVNLQQSLRQGGALLLEMVGKEILARDFHRHGEVILLEERTVSKNWTWYERQGIMLNGEQRQDYRFAHSIYSAAELEALLTESGFRSVAIYGDLAGGPYDHAARRLVAVARK